MKDQKGVNMYHYKQRQKHVPVGPPPFLGITFPGWSWHVAAVVAFGAPKHRGEELSDALPRKRGGALSGAPKKRGGELSGALPRKRGGPSSAVVLSGHLPATSSPWGEGGAPTKKPVSSVRSGVHCSGDPVGEGGGSGPSSGVDMAGRRRSREGRRWEGAVSSISGRRERTRERETGSTGRALCVTEGDGTLF